MASGKPTVVVVGGGFAGLTAVRRLRTKFDVVLIDAKEYWEYYPGVYRAYIHPDQHSKLYALYQTICDSLGVTFYWGEVTKIDDARQEVVVKAMAELKDVTVQFDYLLLTNGSEYGMSMGLKKVSSVAEKCMWYPTFLESTIDETGWGCLDERFLSGRRAHLDAESKAIAELAKAAGTVVIVGAGYVGVEWASELKYFYPKLSVVLTDKSTRCVEDVVPPKCQQAIQAHLDKAGVKCIYGVDFKDSLSTDGVAVGDGIAKFLEAYSVYADRIYICTGMRSVNQFLPDAVLTSKKSSGRGGWITANRSMQVTTKKTGPWGQGRIFAAGNCVVVEGMTLPKTASPAQAMAETACYNIIAEEVALASAKPSKTKELKNKGSFFTQAISLGPKQSTFVVGARGHGQGCLLFRGCMGSCLKGFIKWCKVDQAKGGCIGSCFGACF